MSDRAFLDTNVFIYSVSNEEIVKRDAARGLIKEMTRSGAGRASLQVAQEFLNVSTKKYRKALTTEDALELIQTAIIPLIHDTPDFGLLRDASAIHVRYQVSFYDGLIVAAARRQKCSIIFSEDMQDGMVFQDVRVVNPFVSL